jgi:hypothetical protein
MVAMKLRVRLAALALAAALMVSAPARAQQPALHDPLLDHMAGSWLLTGSVGAKPTTQDVTVDWVIEHRYLRIHEVSREKLPSGEPQYEATVYIGWNAAAARYGCIWLDVYGGLAPISLGTAPRSGNQLPFVFRDADSAFYTTFEYLPATDSWTWRLDNDENGKPVPFARFTMIRAKTRAK